MNDYRELNDEELLGLLFTEADNLPRKAVDEFIRRGDRMVYPLKEIVSEPSNWTTDVPDWWAVVHAVHILGAISTEETIIPLLRALRWADAFWCDWVWNALPSIFKKVGPASLPHLKRIASDRTSGSTTRNVAMESMAAIALNEPSLEDEVFPLIGCILKDATEDREVRDVAGQILLDFKRKEFRDDLFLFAEKEQEMKRQNPCSGFAFDRDDVLEEFARGERKIETYTRDWLKFYDESSIESRQERWTREESER